MPPHQQMVCSTGSNRSAAIVGELWSSIDPRHASPVAPRLKTMVRFSVGLVTSFHAEKERVWDGITGAFVARAFTRHAFFSQVQRATGLNLVGMEERKMPQISSLPAKNGPLHFHSCRFRHGRTDETKEGLINFAVASFYK